MASDSAMGLFDSIVNEKGEKSVKVKSTLEGGVKQELFGSGKHIETQIDPFYPDGNLSNTEDQEKEQGDGDNTLEEIQNVFSKLTEEEADEPYERRVTKYVKDNQKSSSSIKFDYLNPRPQRGSDDESVDHDDDDDDDESDDEDETVAVGKKQLRGDVNSRTFQSLQTRPSTSKNVTSENEKDVDKMEGGPIEQIQHVRKQIKSTKAEIAKLEKMMSHIADLRHALSERDTTQGLNQLAQLSIKDFEEFQTYLMDLPDNESKNAKKEPVVSHETLE